MIYYCKVLNARMNIHFQQLFNSLPLEVCSCLFSWFAVLVEVYNCLHIYSDLQNGWDHVCDTPDIIKPVWSHSCHTRCAYAVKIICPMHKNSKGYTLNFFMIRSVPIKHTPLLLSRSKQLKQKKKLIIWYSCIFSLFITICTPQTEVNKSLMFLFIYQKHSLLLQVSQILFVSVNHNCLF